MMLERTLASACEPTRALARGALSPPVRRILVAGFRGMGMAPPAADGPGVEPTVIRDRSAWFARLGGPESGLLAGDVIGLMIVAECFEAGAALYPKALVDAKATVVLEGGVERPSKRSERNRIASLVTLEAALLSLLADYGTEPFLLAGVLDEGLPGGESTLAIARWFWTWQRTALAEVRGWVMGPPAGTEPRLCALWRAQAELLEILPSIDQSQRAADIAAVTIRARERADGLGSQDRLATWREDEARSVVADLLTAAVPSRVGHDGRWVIDADALRVRLRDQARGPSRSPARCRSCRGRGRAWCRAHPRWECGDCRALEGRVRRVRSLDEPGARAASLGERIGDGGIEAVSRVRQVRDLSALRSELERIQVERVALWTRPNAKAIRAVRANLVNLMLGTRTARSVALEAGCAESRISEAYAEEYRAIKALLQSDPRMRDLLE